MSLLLQAPQKGTCRPACQATPKERAGWQADTLRREQGGPGYPRTALPWWDNWAPLALPVFRPTNQLDDSRFWPNFNSDEGPGRSSAGRKSSHGFCRSPLMDFTPPFLCHPARKGVGGGERHIHDLPVPQILVNHRMSGCKAAQATRAITPESSPIWTVVRPVTTT